MSKPYAIFTANICTKPRFVLMDVRNGQYLKLRHRLFFVDRKHLMNQSQIE